jgi:hypothetical protein
MAVIPERIQLARGTAAAWTASNPVLLAGEAGWESDTGQMKVGDGVTYWTSLPYSIVSGTFDPTTYPAYVTNKSRSSTRLGDVSLYNKKASNSRHLRAGVGRARASQHHAQVVIGDSLSAGCIQGLAAPYGFDRANAWPISMRNELARHGAPIAGTGWVQMTDGNIGQDSRLSFTGTWSNAQLNYSFTTTAFDTVTFTPDMGGSYISVWVYDPGTGAGAYPFNISLNGAVVGGTLTSITGSAVFRTRTVAATVKTGDTITVTAGTNGLYIGGIRVWNPNGTEVHNIAQSSSQASGTGGRAWSDFSAANTLGFDWINAGGVSRTVVDGVLNSGSNILQSATAAFNDGDLGRQVFLTAGPGIQTLVSNTAYITGITDATHVTLSANAAANVTTQTVQIGADPSMVHIALGQNDLSGGASIPTTTTAITNIAAKFPNSDVALHVLAQPATSSIPAATYDAYVSALYDLADTLGCWLFDHRDREGVHTDVEAMHLSGDNLVHQNSAAYAAIGAAVALELLT